MKRKVKYGMMVLVAMGFGMVFLLGSSWGVRQQNKKQEEIKAQLHKLLVERQELLDSRADSAELMLKQGQAALADYARARAKALRARLDLTEQPAERIEIFEKILALYKDTEKNAKLMLDSQRITNLDFMEIKLKRLRAEINLTREKISLIPTPNQKN